MTIMMSHRIMIGPLLIRLAWTHRSPVSPKITPGRLGWTIGPCIWAGHPASVHRDRAKRPWPRIHQWCQQTVGIQNTTSVMNIGGYTEHFAIKSHHFALSVQNFLSLHFTLCFLASDITFYKKLSYRRETTRQLRIHAQLTRCFSAVAV